MAVEGENAIAGEAMTDKGEELEEFLALDSDDNDDNDEAEPQRSQQDVQAGSTGSMDEDVLPPWMAHPVDHGRVNRLVGLHNEIVDFCSLMEPRSDEMAEREKLVERFKALVLSVFPEGVVDVFGSQATGLCLPTSDIDIAIQLGGDDASKTENGSDGNPTKTTSAQEVADMEHWDQPTGSPLQRLAAALREKWLPELSYLEVIENTRVPLVKFTHEPSNISVDVCFNQTNGVQAAKLMHQYMDTLPPLRPLTFVLKYFMASRGLNQPYTGGVGSFLLQMMIVSFLQHREREAMHNRRPSIYNLGALLVEFFELYSMDFNFVTTGISVRFDGFYFPKGAADRKADFWQPSRPFSISMENPFDIATDVGAPSFRIFMVQRSFEIALKVLLSRVTEPYIPATSILASILPPTDEMKNRAIAARFKPLKTPRDKKSPKRDRPRKRQRRA